MAEKEPISFKGTRLGALVSMSEEGSFKDNLSLFQDKLQSNPQFFKGSPLSLDLGWREINSGDLAQLEEFVRTNALSLQGIISSSLATRNLAESKGIKVIIGRLGISEHYSRITKKEPAEARKKSSDLNEETIILRKTVRAGQKIDFNGNIVIHGDINPGGEIIAAGDIIVLGALRGIAHAGAHGNESSLIIAFSLEPTQLKIAHHMVITREMKGQKKNCPVTARIEKGKIVLIPYSGCH